MAEKTLNQTTPSTQALTYCLVVRCGPYQQSQARTAFEFAKTLLSLGHTIERVFFYQQGVHTASSLRITPQDEWDLTQAWQTLAQAHNVELGVCIAAALQAGILDSKEASRYQKDNASLANGFELVGLGQLAAASATCDRLVSFGGQ